MRKQSQGVTLAEVVLAVGLLTIISITVAGVFIHLLHASAKTSDVTAGRALARRLLDRAVRAGPPDWGFPQLPTVVGDPSYKEGGTQILMTQATESQSEFFYRVEWDDLKPADTGIGGVSRELYHVQVVVSWWGDAPDRSQVEMGRLSTKISQVAGYHR